MRKTVLFDLDDTLYPELSFVRSGYREAARFLSEKYHIEGDLYEELNAIFSENPRRVFNRFLDAYDIPYGDSDIKELVALYREHEPCIELFKDALPCLYKLKELGCDLGIISDGYFISQRNKLNALFGNKLNIFGKIILTDELGREYYKPDERSFVMAKEYFKTDWSDMIYVGDNPGKDFYIGNNYPILTIRLKKPETVYENADYLEGIRERILIGDLSELPEIAKRN